MLDIIRELTQNIRFDVVPQKRICPMPDQPREYFDPIKLEELAGSIRAIGQIQPVIVSEIKSTDFDFQLTDGQRRWLACGMAEVEMMKVIIWNVTDSADKFLVSFVANFGHEDHGPMEIANAIERLRREKGLNNRLIAQIVGKSVGWVDQHKMLHNLHEKIQAKMHPSVPDEERVTFSVAVALAPLQKDLQLELTEEIQARGMRIHQARSHIRRRVNILGLVKGIDKRKPVSDFRLLHGFATRIGRDMESFLAMSPTQIVRIFEHRPAEDRIRLVAEFEGIIKQMRSLCHLIATSKS